MSDRTGPEHDAEISASVSADELTFHEVPEIESRTWGDPGYESTSGSERTNLPYGASTGVVYQNIHVDYRLASRIKPPEDFPEHAASPEHEARPESDTEEEEE